MCQAVADRLLPATKDNPKSTRKALRSLALISTSEGKQLVYDSATGEDERLRAIALSALGIASQNGDVRTRANSALRLAGPEALSTLAAAAETEKKAGSRKLLGTASRALRARLEKAGIEIQESEQEDPFEAITTSDLLAHANRIYLPKCDGNCS